MQSFDRASSRASSRALYRRLCSLHAGLRAGLRAGLCVGDRVGDRVGVCGDNRTDVCTDDCIVGGVPLPLSFDFDDSGQCASY